jgi:DNA-binding MarR family transcriptional regulator
VSRHKREIFDELIDEVRRSQAATQRFDAAVAEALGLGRTDMRCLDVLQRSGAMSAGRLAEETGLTSGAMTAALDRLEGKGYVRRVRDGEDRRRVLIEPRPEALAKASTFYGEHQAMSERLYRRYDRAQLELLLQFVRTGREFNERQAVQVERRTREASPGPRTRKRESPAGPRARPREAPGA